MKTHLTAQERMDQSKASKKPLVLFQPLRYAPDRSRQIVMRPGKTAKKRKAESRRKWTLEGK